MELIYVFPFIMLKRTCHPKHRASQHFVHSAKHVLWDDQHLLIVYHKFDPRMAANL